GHGLRGQLRAVRPALLLRPRAVRAEDRRQGPRADRRRPRGRRVRVGGAVGRRRHRRDAGPGGSRRPRRPGARHADPQAQGRRPGRGEAAGPRAQAADEGGRRRPRPGHQPDHDLLLRPAPRRLPRPGPGPRRHPVLPGGAAPAVAAGRGAGAGRDRVVRPGPVLRHVPQGLRTGVHPDGQGPGPPAQPAAHLRRLRPAAVLPEVRAPAVRQGAGDGAPARRRGRHPRGPRPGRRGQRAQRDGQGPAGRRRPYLLLLVRLGLRPADRPRRAVQRL
ncbi:MAG: Stage 0 sporulation protein YaaT, partial [uncultured Corynebacteriales bacterium]